jgi:hypothetical protein
MNARVLSPLAHERTTESHSNKLRTIPSDLGATSAAVLQGNPGAQSKKVRDLN